MNDAKMKGLADTCNAATKVATEAGAKAVLILIDWGDSCSIAVATGNEPQLPHAEALAAASKLIRRGPEIVTKWSEDLLAHATQCTAGGRGPKESLN